MADQKLGLQAVDVSSLVSPKLIGTYAPMPFASGIAAAGGYAYVGVGTGLEAVDVSTPNNPREVGVLRAIR